MKKIDYKSFILFVIPLIPMMFILYVYYPGIYTFDAFTQLIEIQNMKFSTGHPFISTLYLMIFSKLLKSKASVAIFQIVLIDIIWNKICKLNRRNEENKVFIFQIIFTIFVFINPLILCTVISNNKDTIFMLLFMLCCYFIQKNLEFNFKYYDLFMLSLFLILFSNIRHNAVYVNCVFVIVFCILLISKKKTIYYFKTSFFLLSLLLFSLIVKIPFQFFEINNTASSIGGVFSGKALMFDGYLLNSGKLSEKEKVFYLNMLIWILYLYMHMIFLLPIQWHM